MSFEEKEVNFNTEKSEYDWIKTSDTFWLMATPKIFEWLSWTIMLAAVSYASEYSNSAVLSVIRNTSYIALFLYYQSFFYQFRFTGIWFFKSKSSHTQRGVSLFISLILSLATFYIVALSVSALVSHSNKSSKTPKISASIGYVSTYWKHS